MSNQCFQFSINFNINFLGNITQKNKECCHILSILLGDVDVSTEDVDQDTDTISHDPVISDIVLWLPVICVLLLLLLVSSVYVCWRGTGLWKGGFYLSMIFFFMNTKVPKFFFINIFFGVIVFSFKGCGRTNNLNQHWIHNSVQVRISQLAIVCNYHIRLSHSLVSCFPG